jgi:hypothetical protein
MSGSLVPFPFSVFAACLEAGSLAQDSASVLVLRAVALSAVGADAAEEAMRMVAEKPPAFAAAASAAWIATIRGRRAEEVWSAALVPLRTEARANVVRLRSRP